MKKRLIVFIDFSEGSGNLIRYACGWAEQLQARLLLVHHVAVLAPALTDNDVRAGIAAHSKVRALKELKSLVEEVMPESTSHPQYEVFESDIKSKLSGLLSASFDNLLLLGLKGTSFLKQLFIGSVAIEVIEHAGAVVAAIPKQLSAFNPRQLYVGVSDKHPLNISALEQLLCFMPEELEAIIFFHVMESEEDTGEIQRELEALCSVFGGKHTTSFTLYRGSVDLEEMRRIVTDKTDCLLVLQKGSRLLLDQLLRKFMVNELVYYGQIPLIVLP